MDKNIFRICRHCGDKFIPKHFNQRNCKKIIKKICPTCGREFSYLCGDHESNYCSIACINRDPNMKERIKNTQKERYGDYGFNTEKARQTLLEKYGVDNCMKNETIKQKTRKTQFEKYGQFAFNTDEGKEKARINSHTDISNQLRRQSILETIREADQEQIMKIRGQCISKKTQAVKERIEKLTGISFNYETVCDEHVYDLGYKKLLIEVNPTESHNVTFSFNELTSLNPKSNGHEITKYYHIDRQKDAESKGYELVQIFDFTNQWEDIVVNKLVKLGYLKAECKDVKEIRSDEPNCHIVRFDNRHPKVEVYDAGIIYLVEKCEEPIKKLTKIDKVQNSYDVETASDRFILDGVHSFNCRTRVIGNSAKPENEVYTGRGNFSFTTINLPRLGIEAKGDWDKFYKDFDHMIDLAKDQLLDRFEMISHKHVYNYPFLMQQGVWIDSDNLDLNDEIGEVLKNASISIGFIGLAECLKAMMGKHHGESEEAYQKGLEIIQHLRNKTDGFTKQYNLNFSTFASPAEGLSGRFTRLDKKRYGIIEGVTDREYYTNSFHIPVYFKIPAYKKMQLEGKFHELCNAGAITYIEMDGNLTKNVQAFEDIVKYAGECGISYFSINHAVDRCPICGYTGIIGDECPRCGFREGVGVSLEHLKECGIDLRKLALKE